MPVNVGKEGEFDGFTGNCDAIPTTIAEKLVEGKDGRPDALRVTFDVQGKDETLSLFVPLDEGAKDRVHPFVDSTDGMPTDEAGLRQWLAANMKAEPFFVYASNGSVRGVTAKPGKHRVRLTGLLKFTRRSDNAPRVRFFAENRDKETVTWTVTYPALVCIIGTTPQEDDIGPASELKPDKYLFLYLSAFGLDWNRFVSEMSAAYERGELFARLTLDGEKPGFFHDANDITEELFQAVFRHGETWAEVEVVEHPEYGIGPKRGEWSKIQLTPVIVEGGTTTDPAAEEFAKERERFLAAWDTLAAVTADDKDARFMAGTNLTTQGRALAVAVLKPLVVAYPDAVTAGANPDGTPAVSLPPSPDTWNVNGVVAASVTAERLMKLGPEKLAEMVDLADPRATGKRVVAWASDALAFEWQGAGYQEEGVTL